MKTRKKTLGIIAGTAAIGVAGAMHATKTRKYPGIIWTRHCADSDKEWKLEKSREYN